jgi:hypothetical protein
MKSFLSRSRWSVADRIAALLLVLVAAWSSTSLLFPASLWIQVDRVHVSDTLAGVSPVIEVDRRLYRGTDHGRYAVVIREADSHQTECIARRAVPYSAGAAASPIRGKTLSWWAYSADGECVRWPVPPGQYYVETRHCWRAFWWARESCTAWHASNVFTVRVPS